MITLQWIDREIEAALAQEPSPRTVYDLAALYAVRDHLLPAPAASPALSTMDDIEQALNSIIAQTPDDARRLRDAQTIYGIMTGKTD